MIWGYHYFWKHPYQFWSNLYMSFISFTNSSHFTWDDLSLPSSYASFLKFLPEGGEEKHRLSCEIQSWCGARPVRISTGGSVMGTGSWWIVATFKQWEIWWLGSPGGLKIRVGITPWHNNPLTLGDLNLINPKHRAPNHWLIPSQEYICIQYTLPETTIFAPKNGWLEYYIVSFWGQKALFSGANLLAVSFKEGILLSCYCPSTKKNTWKLKHVGVSKNRWILPPKWMVYFMENPMNKWMTWGAHPYFWKHPSGQFIINP